MKSMSGMPNVNENRLQELTHEIEVVTWWMEACTVGSPKYVAFREGLRRLEKERDRLLTIQGVKI